MKKSKSLKFTKNEKLLVSALAFFQFTHIVDFMLLMPLGPVLIDQFAINNEEFSYLVSAYTFSAGLTALFASTFIDRYSRKKVLIFVFTGFLFGTLLCGLSPTYQLLLFSRIITGAFGGLINSMVYSIIGDSFAYERRGSATGIVMASFSAASVLGIPISLFIANRFGWNWPFIVLFLVGFVFIAYAFFAIPISDRVPQKHAYADIFREKNHYPAFFLILAMMLAGFSMIPYISNFLVFDTVMTQEKLPMMYLLGGAATYITSRLFGYLSDRYGKKIMFYILATSSMVPMYMISRINYAYSVYGILAITTMFFIFTSGRMVPGMALITSVVSPKMRGSFMTFNTAIQQMSAGLATFLGGKIIAAESGHRMTGYQYVSYLAIAATFLSIGFVYIMRLHDEKNRVLE
ncbi:MAG: MFS transporter [Spirochaetia bacterium]|nr:MFS transporter [Spirochaetia bacterium]